MYSVNGRSAATAATADHVVFGIWNPHASQRIKVVSLFMFANSAAPGAGYAVRLRRITTQGTPATTVTPTIENQSQRGIAPGSGVILGLASYGASQPTLGTLDLSLRYTFAAVQGSGIVFPIPGGIEIGPGAGVAVIQVPATAAPTFDVGFSWLEDW